MQSTIRGVVARTLHPRGAEQHDPEGVLSDMTPQVVGDPDMDDLWNELLSAHGSEFYMRGAEEYIPLETLRASAGTPFWQVGEMKN